MSFRDIIGQESVVNFLQQALRTQRVSHAYLFLGPSGVGKMLTARTLAKALNCQVEKDDSCDLCSSCQKIDRNLHPDVKILSPEGRSLGIEQVRTLQKEISFRPYEGRFKIFILEAVERITHQAANCLLKTLEEPPGEAVLILITSSMATLLPTVVSRCQLARFRLLNSLELEKVLQDKFKFPADEARLLAALGGGSLEKSLSFKTNETLNSRKEMENCWKEIQKVKFPGIFRQIEEFSRNREKAQKFVDFLTLWFRDLLVLRESGKEEYLLNPDYQHWLKTQVSLFSTSRLIEILKELEETRQLLSRNVNIRLALEVLLLKIFHPAKEKVMV